jgi:stage V sporulation protein SpoVS
MTGHLDADRLADFRAGLLRGGQARRASAHLASCDSCAALDAQLASLSSLLAAVPAPQLPPDVTTRLDAALAAAIAERGAPSPASNLARRPRARRFTLPKVSWRALAPAAAAVAVIGAGAGLGLSLIGGGSSMSGADSGGAAALPAAAGSAVRSPDKLGFQALTPSPKYQSEKSAVAGSSPAPFGMSSPAFNVVISSTDYQPASVRAALAAQLRSLPAHQVQQTPAPEPVIDCVQAITATRPVLVEEAMYAGKPALLVAVRRETAFHVWIAADSCTSAQDVLTQFDVP